MKAIVIMAIGAAAGTAVTIATSRLPRKMVVALVAATGRLAHRSARLILATTGQQLGIVSEQAAPDNVKKDKRLRPGCCPGLKFVSS